MKRPKFKKAKFKKSDVGSSMITPPTWMGKPVPENLVLRGERAALVPLAREHAADLLAAGRAPEIWALIAGPSSGPFATEAAALAWIDAALAESVERVRLPFAILDAAGRAVGSTSYFFDPRWPNLTVEIGGTWLDTACWRSAVNTECKYLLLTEAFEHLGAARVELMTDARNERSRRAIERIGATCEGVSRRSMLRPDGHRRDSVIYSIIDEEWLAVRAKLGEMLARA